MTKELLTIGCVVIPTISIFTIRYFDRKSPLWLFMVYFGSLMIAFALGQVLTLFRSEMAGVICLAATLIVWGWIAKVGFRTSWFNAIAIALLPLCFFLLILFYVARHHLTQ
jgi:hypothetical protein